MLSTKDIVLLLLSSVLVSSDTAQQRRAQDVEGGVNSGEEKESEEIGEAVMISEANGGAPHPKFTKQLDTKWTFWYESKAKRDKGRNLSKSDYLKDMKKGKTFDTIASFWDCWKEVQTECNPSSGDCNYELFKHGVKPVWEDPKNIKGGRCVLTPPRTTQEETMKQWVSLMITLLIGEFGPDINGVVLTTRSWGNTFAVWVRNSKDRDTVDATMKQLHELFGDRAQIKFQRHQASIRKKLDNGTKPATFGAGRSQSTNFSTLEKKRYSESEESSSEGEQTREKNKGKEQPRRRSVVTEDTKGMLHSLLQEVTAAPVQPPIDRINLEDKAMSSARVAPREVSSPRFNLEESSVERPFTQKRRPSTSSPSNKPTPKKELPNLSDLSARHFGIGLVVIFAGVATSILSWSYL